MNLTEFCEKRLLPVVLAFACGVLVMDVADARRVEEARSQAQRAVDLAVQFRALCGDEEPAEEVAFVDPVQLQGATR
ncbi:hypothetical protein SAMN05421829_108133 [Aromatoleum tolulyticum]|uniref:Uncharacterized protein n=1 Tax=Aromatoleum tolulyticum TaxID=34027 RepID=A0A1N6WZL7_9RHOO|nr:hypothetical protein [Aromatoleum tolulyticum]SIQ95461.1 hypothetical protein SAMN05421829_108133 [Aromatoleum tolulyticum]